MTHKRKFRAPQPLPETGHPFILAQLPWEGTRGRVEEQIDEGKVTTRQRRGAS